MGTLLHPVGPRARGVYWLRRIVVLIIVVALVAAVWWVVGLIRGASAQQGVPAQGTPGASAAGTPAVVVASAPVETPTGPQPCTSATVNLVGYQTLKVTAKQVFVVTITNSGVADCVLTVTPSTLSLTVTSGSDRIWTTSQCAKWAPTKTVTLTPGKSQEFTIDWPLTRSTANCGTSAVALKPGTYVATASLTQGSASMTGRQVMTLTKA